MLAACTRSLAQVKEGFPKGLPLVSHGLLGTMYEEPCLSFVRLELYAFINIDPERLLSTAVTSNRTIRVSGDSMLLHASMQVLAWARLAV